MTTAAVTDMPIEEQRHRDPMEIIRHGIDTERGGRAVWVYTLWELYRITPKSERQALLDGVSAERNIAPDRIEQYLRVPERIPGRLLAQAFPLTPDGAQSWALHLTWSHLERAAQAGGDQYGAADRIKWLVHAADQHLSLGGFTDHLREEGIIKARQPKGFGPEDGAREAEHIAKGREAIAYLSACLAGDYGPHVQERVGRSWSRKQANTPEASAPSTACTMAIAILERLRAEGHDIDLTQTLTRRRQSGKPLDVKAFLEFTASELERRWPGLTHTLKSLEEGR